MRDAAEMAVPMAAARLRRELDENECKRRNALSKTIPGFTLHTGDVGTVLETRSHTGYLGLEWIEPPRHHSIEQK